MTLPMRVPGAILDMPDERPTMRPDRHAKVQHWIKPAPSDHKGEPGYDEWLAAEIAAGLAELDAGKVTPLDDVKREFGQE